MSPVLARKPTSGLKGSRNKKQTEKSAALLAATTIIAAEEKKSSSGSQKQRKAKNQTPVSSEKESITSNSKTHYL